MPVGAPQADEGARNNTQRRQNRNMAMLLNMVMLCFQEQLLQEATLSVMM